MQSSVLSVMLMCCTAPIPAEPPPDPLGRAFLGVTASRDDNPQGIPMPMPADAGVVVTGFVGNSPAQKAGMQEGDRIVSVGKAKTNTFSELIGTLGGYRPGAVVEVKVMRGEKEMTFAVRLTARPPDPEP